MTTCSSCGAEAAQDFRFCPECGAASVDDLAAGDPLVGRILGGKYRVAEAIGSGSMGRVYLAEHITLRKRVAIKVLHRDLQVADDAIARFLREGIAAGQISHPSVLQIFDFERTDDGYCYLAMEYVAGHDLKRWLAKRGPLSVDTAIGLVRQVLGALTEAHRHGVVHRDLKPENLMIVESPTVGMTVKVLDFGLSRLVDTRLDLTQQTIPGRLMGTPLYMAPEQWRGEPADHRADLYAVTLILYEMLVGRQPFEASDLTEVMVKTTQHEPPTLVDAGFDRDVPAGLEDVVARGLAKSREQRFQSASDMIDALDAVLAGDPVAVPVAGRTTVSDRGKPTKRHRIRNQRPAERASSSRRGIWIGMTAVLAVALVSAWAFGGRGSDSAGAARSMLSQRPAGELDDSQRAYVHSLAAARSRLVRGDPRGALEELESALEMDVRDAEALAIRGSAYRLLDDGDLALVDYREALAAYPRLAEAEAGIGWLHLDSGGLEGAAARFDAALAIDPNSIDGVTGRAALLLARGEADQACACLDAVEGDAPMLNLWRGRARLAAGDAESARTAFALAKRDASRLAAPAEGLGDAYTAIGDLRKAEGQYEDAFDRASDDRERQRIRRKLAESIAAQGRLAAAAERLGPALELGDGELDGATLELAAAIAAQRDQLGDAVDYLERLTELGRDRVGDPRAVWTLLASLRLEAGDAPGALVAVRRADEADGEVTNALATTWGLALFRAGEHMLAAEKFEQAIELDASDLFSRYTLGVLYMDYLGDEDFACEQFEAYLSAGGSDPRVREWIQRLGG